MKISGQIGIILSTIFTVSVAFTTYASAQTISLFDGRTFRGWEGDTTSIWSIKDGTITAGSLTESLPHNNFLCTERLYSNFILRFQVKLEGTEGFVNAGVQFRSCRLAAPAYEMVGYQVDMGPGYWGALYDESRRNKIIGIPDSVKIARIVRLNDWNDITVKCQDRRVRLYLNGDQTVDYTESDQTLPESGTIGLQIHGGGKTKVSYKNLFIKELK